MVFRSRIGRPWIRWWRRRRLMLSIKLHSPHPRSVRAENPFPGQQVSYTLTVANDGSQPAASVSLVDRLPED